MRPTFAIALIVVVIGGILGVSRATRFDPGDDAVVRALTRAPVRVQLDFSPNAEEVTGALLDALAAAADDEAQAEIAAELIDIANDASFIAELATHTVERLRTDAVALAFSTTAVDGEDDAVTIIGITIEMLPRGSQDGISRDHEDGHASINNEIVQRCSDEVVAFEIGTGEKGNGLVEAINDHLNLLEDQAHAQYHVEVTDGVFGSHSRAASRAIENLERSGCVAPSG